MLKENWIKVFKVGKYPQGDFTLDRVSKMVESYNENEDRKAPIKIGHNQEDESAHGWIEELSLDQDFVYARISAISNELKEKIESEALKYGSSEIYPADELGEGDAPVFLAFAFLGITPPEIEEVKIENSHAFAKKNRRSFNFFTKVDKKNPILSREDKIADFFSSMVHRGVIMPAEKQVHVNFASSLSDRDLRDYKEFFKKKPCKLNVNGFSKVEELKKKDGAMHYDFCSYSDDKNLYAKRIKEFQIAKGILSFSDAVAAYEQEKKYKL